MAHSITVRDCDLLTEIKRALNLPLDPHPLDQAAHQVVANAFLESTVAIATELAETRLKVLAVEGKLSKVKLALLSHQSAVKDVIELTK